MLSSSQVHSSLANEINKKGGHKPPFFHHQCSCCIYFTFSITALNASGWFIARSASTLRLSSIPLLLSFPMNSLYDMPLYPKATEVSFLVLATYVSILHSFLYSILRYGPNILTTTKVSFGLLHYFLASCSRRYTVY